MRIYREMGVHLAQNPSTHPLKGGLLHSLNHSTLAKGEEHHATKTMKLRQQRDWSLKEKAITTSSLPFQLFSTSAASIHKKAGLGIGRELFTFNFSEDSIPFHDSLTKSCQKEYVLHNQESGFAHLYLWRCLVLHQHYVFFTIRCWHIDCLE